ncbi:MAG: toxic anion resistance protein [Candidatus Gracilibacteria bacterium]|nr:toxic anion resistance protein [Candidatus Gracilibacteria bacterium]
MTNQNETQTLTPANSDAAVFGINETKNLPMVIETSGDKDLINRSEMSQEELQNVATIVNGHDIMDTASNLYFGASPQKDLNQVLDELLNGVKTKEAGLAGKLAVELNDGINLLKLDETKNQIINGQGWFARNFAWLVSFFGGIANYIDYLIQSQDTITSKFDELVNKYNNRIKTLSNESEKLDRLRDASIAQINGLRIHIAAGEDILKLAKNRYEKEAQEAIQSNDTLKLQAVRDFYQQIASFDTRYLQLKHAYVESSAVMIPRVRRTQEAIKIEIEGIVRGILFVIPKLKASVIELLALYETKSAQADRMALDDVESRINKHTTGVIDEVVSVAKQSQGLALKRAQELEQVVKSTVEAIKADRENEKQSAENRREAEKLLLKLKQEVDVTIKNANIDAANEKF